ncbi:uncharacterized protein LOC117282054 [Cryptotermes secundus]|uniref:uncharacterized protein LOC117282054 n=1 Tax=Cryptotermes secundus TaxID=105785 RepID=UPI001454BB64|nr:uncharacterized protein LOC117282054 [Cryptotermes secundus]
MHTTPGEIRSKYEVRKCYYDTSSKSYFCIISIFRCSLLSTVESRRRAMVWAGRVGLSCTTDSATMLYHKVLCSKHFSESDFTTAERVHLNRFAVPYGTDSAAQSPPQPPGHSLHTSSFDPLPSGLTPESELNVLPPTRTYSKTLVPSAVAPVPVHADSPSTSFKMSAIQLSPTAANILPAKETSLLLGSENIYASDGALRHIRCQSSSSKPRARRSLLKELNLALLSELTPRKRKLYEQIWNKESAQAEKSVMLQ